MILAKKWPSSTPQFLLHQKVSVIVIHFTWETVFRHIYGSRFGRLITVDVDGREAELTEEERRRLMVAV